MTLKRFQYLFLILVLSYLLLTFLTPIDPATTARYNLSEFQVRLIGMSVSVPLAIIWLVALYGYSRFHSYTELIAREKEGKGFKEITQGIMILVLSLPVPALASSIIRRLTLDDPNFATYAVIGRSYLPVLFQLVAFTFIAAGSAKLLTLLKPKVVVRHSDYVIVSLIAAASLFAYIIVARPFGGSVAQNYGLPAWVVILTIVIPFIFAWYKGGLAIYQLYLYRKRVSGSLYRKMLNDLVIGLSTITAIAILIQILGSVSGSLTRLNFTPLLIMVYALILLYAVGYGLLARGAKQLKKIEEV